MEFIVGGIIGGAQVIVGHPLDTYKVWKQTGLITSKDDIKKCLKFKGMSVPLVTNGILNSVLFGVYTKMKNNNYSQLTSSAVSGLCGGIVMCPIDVYKINCQNNKKVTLKNFKPFRGLIGSLAVEIPATIVYFGTWNYLESLFDNSLISGGFAGMTAWLSIYPIDVIKTRLQSDYSLTYKKAIAMGNFNKGITPCLIRAFIINSVAFYLYKAYNSNTF